MSEAYRPRLYDLSPGRKTGMLDQSGAEVLEGDRVLCFNCTGHPEGIPGVIRLAAWSELSPRVEDGWVVLLDSEVFIGVTADFSAEPCGIRKL